MEKKPIYQLPALENLNNILPAIISNGAYLRAGETISDRVSKYTL